MSFMFWNLFSFLLSIQSLPTALVICDCVIATPNVVASYNTCLGFLFESTSGLSTTKWGALPPAKLCHCSITGSPQGPDGSHMVCVTLVVHSLSDIQHFAPPWTAACQASLSLTISWSLPKFMSIELVMLSNHLILCLLPSPFAFQSGSFPVSWLFTSGDQDIGASASASVLPINIQG